ncbi:ATP-dependent zinc protease family protein [Microbacterium sp. YY-01]|uniref:ATP-dependent zinc protease family protein n=1 Tax=Microbacterium sp. YY-01 TaxID=3421634 RepID=UPI003D17B04F
MIEVVQRSSYSNTILGWREWVSLPDLGVSWLKAKIDTGARTSALHAFDIHEYESPDGPRVRFRVHPWQNNDDDSVEADLAVHDRRMVRSSTGHQQSRIVVIATVRLLGEDVPCEVTLTNRDAMGFRMLIGREALRQRFVVDPARSFMGGRPERAIRRRNREG